MPEYSSEVVFNQAQFQQIRLHEVMQRINMCWSNLSGVIEGIQAHNLLFEGLCAYYLEIRSTLKNDELETCDKSMDELETFLSEHSIWVDNNSFSMAGSSNKRTINSKTYIEIRKKLRDFQKEILMAAQKHGFGNPTKKDPRAAVIN